MIFVTQKKKKKNAIWIIEEFLLTEKSPFGWVPYTRQGRGDGPSRLPREKKESLSLNSAAWKEGASAKREGCRLLQKLRLSKVRSILGA